MKESDQIRDRRINKHGEEIDNLNKVVNLHELRLNKIDDCNLLKNKEEIKMKFGINCGHAVAGPGSGAVGIINESVKQEK